MNKKEKEKKDGNEMQDRIINEGRFAFLGNISKDENPYLDETNYGDAWIEGYELSMRENTEKLCKKCNQIKLLIDFYKHKSLADGHQHCCIVCTKVYADSYKEKLKPDHNKKEN